jgi:spore maturation protein CgeB
MKLAILGLSITSSWGNGHATTYRSLLREWHELGHEAIFLERDVPWYAAQRDMPAPPFCEVLLYNDLDDLRDRLAGVIKTADAVMVGSYTPEGVAVGEWVLSIASGITSFYDIDTPVTLAQLVRGACEYLSPELIKKYQFYLSFAGGPILDRLEDDYGSPAARALYCSVDPDLYYPEKVEEQWVLGYLGTYSSDRQGALDTLLINPALELSDQQFVVAGPQYPPGINWPVNVKRVEHLPPDQHRRYYCQQRFTLNITRADMRRAGFSPSVRLFEAAACGTPIISDTWEGIESFFEPGEEILLARDSREVTEMLCGLSDKERFSLSVKARRRVLRDHTARCRAEELAGIFSGGSGLSKK